MKKQFMRSIKSLVCACCLLSVTLHHAANAQPTSQKNSTGDTLKYVVLLLDQIKGATVAPGYQPATLSTSEIAELEKLLQQCVADWNKRLSKNSLSYIDLAKHKRQYVPSLNKNGEKQVWVNCFCSAMHADWKQTIIMVEDGGSCYFNVVINLSKKDCVQFQVNGVG